MQNGPTGHPPTGPDNLDMKWRLIYWLVMQGLGVVVMAVGLYVLYQERREERRQASACNERLQELYAEQVEIIRDLRDYIKAPPIPTTKTRFKR